MVGGRNGGPGTGVLKAGCLDRHLRFGRALSRVITLNFFRRPNHMIPVILSGGSGTRLWPVSRAHYPKQFCEFYDHSFLRDTIERLRPFGRPYVLTVKSMESLTLRTMAQLGVGEEYAIFEPFGKNTAPAMALLCHFLNLRGRGEEVVGVFPADHLVADTKCFQTAIELGERVAAGGDIVTLGIDPHYPATGYGYIEVTDQVLDRQGALEAHCVDGFREKPDASTAVKFVESGRHYWNAGMFIFKVSTMIEKLKAHLPEVWEKVSSIKDDLSDVKYAYAALESISIDYGIMEKLDRLVCIPCDMGWSDVGSWDEMARLQEEMPQLRAGSAAQTFPVDAEHNYVFSIRDKVIGLVGVNNLLVVDTPDALLVAKKGQSQKVKTLVNEIKQAGSSVTDEHLFEYRPWGGFEVLSDGTDFKAKTIKVDPGAQLSYQSHAKRSEHWIIIEGEAEITLDDVIHERKTGEYIFIPLGAKHRIKNVGEGPLKFVEVQTGSYFGEDDIVRYQDDYNRV